jgi:hypothetical protein
MMVVMVIIILIIVILMRVVTRTLVPRILTMVANDDHADHDIRLIMNVNAFDQSRSAMHGSPRRAVPAAGTSVPAGSQA